MTPLRRALADYLAMRRALGYHLARAEKLLAQFLAYLEDRGETRLRTETALAWATLPTGADPRLVDKPTHPGARFRDLPAHDRPRYAGTARRPVAGAPAARHAVPVHRRGRGGPAGRGIGIAHHASGGDLSDPDRSAGRDRNAGRRSHRARSARLRRRAGADHRSAGQAREIPRPSVASHRHHRGPAVRTDRRPATPPRCSCPPPAPGC